MKVLFLLLTIVGALGFLFVLIWAIRIEGFSNGDYELAYIIAMVSMMFMMVGVRGCAELKKRLP